MLRKKNILLSVLRMLKVFGRVFAFVVVARQN